jgi:hypothetical protein
MGDVHLARLRIAMKFSLWTWAAYWAGGGLILLAAGMRDPVSLVMALLLLAGFFLLVSMGAFRLEGAGPRMRQWVVERPIYLLAAFIGFVVTGAFSSAAAGIGLWVFAALYVGGIVLCIVRAVQYVQASGKSVFAAGADQVLLLLTLAVPFAVMVLVDAVPGGNAGTPLALVGIGNWFQLLYAPLLLVAGRPFREPLQRPWGARRKPAAPPAAAPAARAASARAGAAAQR